MNKKISVVLASLLVYGCSVSFSQRPLPYVQEKKEFAADDVVGTWKWFCGSVVTIKNNGDVKAVWADGRSEDAKYEKIGDNKYRFNWGHNEWIDILRLKQQGNILEGVNQRGDKVTANRISSGEVIDKNKTAKKAGSSEAFYSNFLKSIEGPYAYRPYENGYHKGVITVLEKDEKGVPKVYQWKNEAGVFWKLYPTENIFILKTDNSNPYFNENRHLQFILAADKKGDLLPKPLAYMFGGNVFWFEK